MAGPVWRKCLLVDIARPFYRRTHGRSGTRIVCGPIPRAGGSCRESWKLMAFASLQAQLSAFPTRRRSVPGRQPINSFLSRSLRTAVALLEELLRRLTRSVDFAVN